MITKVKAAICVYPKGSFRNHIANIGIITGPSVRTIAVLDGSIDDIAAASKSRTTVAINGIGRIKRNAGVGIVSCD